MDSDSFVVIDPAHAQVLDPQARAALPVVVMLPLTLGEAEGIFAFAQREDLDPAQLLQAWVRDRYAIETSDRHIYLSEAIAALRALEAAV